MEHDDVQGTVKGWDLHMRRGTKPCTPCREAHNADVMEHYHAHGRPRQEHERRHYSDACPDWTEQDHSAALAAAGRAKDKDDCQLLLQALGLVPSTVQALERIGSAA